MSASSEKLSLVWDDLKPGIDLIFHATIKRKRYMTMLTHVYNYCTSVDQSAQSYARSIHVETSKGGKLVGQELYKKLYDYLKHHVASLKVMSDDLIGEELLTYFENSWKEYRFAARVLDGVCEYLNRNWIKREHEEGRKKVYVVYALALLIWREHFLKLRSGPLISAILREIERERCGEVISTSRLRVIIDCLVDLGITADQVPCQHQVSSAVTGAPIAQSHFASSSWRHTANCPSTSQAPNVTADSEPGNRPKPQSLSRLRPSLQPAGSTSAACDILPPTASLSSQENRSELSVYQSYFEKCFLAETEHFYKLESAQFLTANNVTDYLQKVEVRMNEERARVQAYLHLSTLPKVMERCEQSLIGQHIDRLTVNFPTILNEGNREALLRMYKLLGRFPQGMNALVSMMEAHVEEKGTTALRQICQAAITNPKLYVDTIMQIQRKNYHLIQDVFSNDHAFVRALDKGCERFINRNAVTELAGTPRKSPELLAKYVDLLLKKSAKEPQPDDPDDILSSVMDVFKYVEDKDVFQKFYCKTLARRLVNNQSVSEDAEAAMISRLKDTCGFEYTAKLLRMFQDVGASRDLNAKFVKHLSDEPTLKASIEGIDFSLMVLSSNAWPFQPQPSFSIPVELETCYNVFSEFYQKHHTGRKLTWYYHLSRGVIAPNYTKTRFTFQVSTYQIAVLMLFNNSLVHTLSSIQSQTGIEMPTLLQVIQILLKARVLKQLAPEVPTAAESNKPAKATTDTEAEEETENSNLTPESRLRLYTDYNNKRFHVNLNIPLKSEAKQETEKTMGNVESDRKLIIQACIVRIMKTRKVMKHQQLLTEVISQLASRFRPTVPLIKSCLNSLMEREYIKRDNNEWDTYEYLA